MRKLKLELAESELKFVLEGLIELEEKMINTCDSSDNEDEVADIGNDLIELRLLLNPLKKEAVEQFGSGILNFSHEEL